MLRIDQALKIKLPSSNVLLDRATDWKDGWPNCCGLTAATQYHTATHSLPFFPEGWGGELKKAVEHMDWYKNSLLIETKYSSNAAAVA